MSDESLIAESLSQGDPAAVDPTDVDTASSEAREHLDDESERTTNLGAAEQRLQGQQRFDALLEMWKQTVTVQQHFNDLEWKIRGLALTIVTFTLGAAALAADKKTMFVLFGKTANASGVIMCAGALIWLAFYFVDRVWYHPLLVGSVKHAATLEDAMRRYVPETGLGGQISDESATPLWFTSHYKAKRAKSRDSAGIRPKGVLRSNKKVGFFYLGCFALLAILGVALLVYAP